MEQGQRGWNQQKSNPKRNGEKSAVGTGTYAARPRIIKVTAGGKLLNLIIDNMHKESYELIPFILVNVNGFSPLWVPTLSLNMTFYRYNGDGRLGFGSNDPSLQLKPKRLSGNWRKVSAGHFHSCGIKTNGYAYW